MGELVVYDQKRHRVHILNRTSALVWRHCDGQTTVADMATLLHSELNLPADEEVVWLALRKLERAHLLRERLMRPAGAAGITRLEAIRKLRVAGIAAVLLPVVTSIVAPTPASAATPPPIEE
jgi:hypothetical protein